MTDKKKLIYTEKKLYESWEFMDDADNRWEVELHLRPEKDGVSGRIHIRLRAHSNFNSKKDIYLVTKLKEYICHIDDEKFIEKELE